MSDSFLNFKLLSCYLSKQVSRRGCGRAKRSYTAGCIQSHCPNYPNTLQSVLCRRRKSQQRSNVVLFYIDFTCLVQWKLITGTSKWVASYPALHHSTSIQSHTHYFSTHEFPVTASSFDSIQLNTVTLYCPLHPISSTANITHSTSLASF